VKASAASTLLAQGPSFAVSFEEVVMMIRQVLARVAITTAFFLAPIVACGGSTGDAILGAAGNASSSGTSGGTSGNPKPSCDALCAACPPNTRAVLGEGCCPKCEPIADQCAGAADSCTNKKACDAGYERFEYAPGCCDCRLSQCANVTCAPWSGCGPNEHVDLGGCCPVCVSDTACKNGSVPCSGFTCPVGFKAVGLPSDGADCCSSCTPDPNYCSTERTAYRTWLTDRLAQQGTLACDQTPDCEIVKLTNACDDDCGTSVAKTASQQLLQDVKDYGNQHCKDCPKVPVGCPAVVQLPTCNNNKCAVKNAL
jgi:hypothetical protein